MSRGISWKTAASSFVTAFCFSSSVEPPLTVAIKSSRPRLSLVSTPLADPTCNQICRKLEIKLSAVKRKIFYLEVREKAVRVDISVGISDVSQGGRERSRRGLSAPLQLPQRARGERGKEAGVCVALDAKDSLILYSICFTSPASHR